MQVLPSNVNDNPKFDVVKYPRTTLKLTARCQSLEKQIYSVIKKIKRVYPALRSFVYEKVGRNYLRKCWNIRLKVVRTARAQTLVRKLGNLLRADCESNRRT
jgi:hypothetical protein